MYYFCGVLLAFYLMHLYEGKVTGITEFIGRLCLCLFSWVAVIVVGLMLLIEAPRKFRK